MNWDAKDLPGAFKAFKSHADFMFGGPLQKQTEAIKCNYLMIWAGEKGRAIFSTWTLLDEEKNKLKTYYEKFEQFVKPRSNIIYSRFMLKSRHQQDGESFEQFITDLKILLKDCGYDEAIHDDVIRDHIVFGIRSSKIREKLINEGSDLTLQKCTDIARTYEMSQAQVKVMAANPDSKSIDAVKHKIRKQPPRQPSRQPIGSYSGTGP